MSHTTKTLGALGVALLALAIYLSVFVFKFYVLFYGALGLTFVALAVIVMLTAGRDPFAQPRK